MTPQEINVAIARACGWTIEDSPQGNAWHHDGICSEVAPPDYHSSLDAMHEAEKCLTDEQWGDYVSILEWVIGIEGQSSRTRKIKAIHATAPQRAEAFLRTIGKWSEQARKGEK